MNANELPIAQKVNSKSIPNVLKQYRDIRRGFNHNILFINK